MGFKTFLPAILLTFIMLAASGDDEKTQAEKIMGKVI
jgi:hypothetical protein